MCMLTHGCKMMVIETSKTTKFGLVSITTCLYNNMLVSSSCHLEALKCMAPITLSSVGAQTILCFIIICIG